MNTIDPLAALRIAALATTLAATSAMAGTDEPLLRELAKTDGDFSGNDAILPRDTRDIGRAKASEDFLRELARTDGGPLVVQAYKPFDTLAGATAPADKAEIAKKLRDLARAGFDLSGG